MIFDYQTCMRPVLVLLADGQTQCKRDLVATLEEESHLTPEERNALLPSGKQRVMTSRVGWAITYLFKADLIERPTRGHTRITGTGCEALVVHPERINTRTLESYPPFREFLQCTGTSGGSPEQAAAAELPTVSIPADPVRQAIRANRVVVEAEVLAVAVDISPAGFEHLAIQPLAAAGCGQHGSFERTPLSNDGGIDGIVSQGLSGLDRIYVQAKCWALHHSVGRPEIQRSAGALFSKQGDRGVYATTATFTRGVHDEAERINARIELVNGQRLAQLFVHYGVGVQSEPTPSFIRLGGDFFDAL